MLKRDMIFYSACVLSAVGLLLAFMGFDFSLMLFVMAYLLRPALHEFGMAKQYADERELKIHSRSGNLAFVILMVAIGGMVLWRLSDGRLAGELYSLIGIGLASRAITGLVMGREYRKAGIMIISAVGIFLGIFIILDGGVSLVSIFGIVLGLIIVGIGLLGKQLPRVVAIFISFIICFIILVLGLLQFERASMAGWLFIVMPLATAVVCLFLGSGNEENISSRVRSISFGSLGTVAVIIFTTVLTLGKSNSGETSKIPVGEIIEVQGIACTESINYYKDGTLEYCFLAREDTISGQSLPKGMGVHFDTLAQFDWCFLQENYEVQGYFTLGDGHGFQTAFHPNGQVRTVYLVEDQLIQDIPCSKFRFLSAIFSPLHGKPGGTYFHENGQMKYCELSENATIQGTDFRRGDAVRFDTEGTLIK